jgi:hypothetical protein
MTTLQEHYTSIARQGQEASLAVIEAWTRSFQDAASRFPEVTGQIDANQVIDRVFDFAVTVVDVQRDFAKQLVSTTVSVAEDVAQQSRDAANRAAAEASNVVTNGRTKKPASE